MYPISNIPCGHWLIKLPPPRQTPMFITRPPRTILLSITHSPPTQPRTDLTFCPSSSCPSSASFPPSSFFCHSPRPPVAAIVTVGLIPIHVHRRGRCHRRRRRPYVICGAPIHPLRRSPTIRHPLTQGGSYFLSFFFLSFFGVFPSFFFFLSFFFSSSAPSLPSSPPD